MDANSCQEAAKKSALEDLSREDLIKKCKGLLVIAQKAKQAKDILQEENNELKTKLKTQTALSQDATSEIIENLTQQKLQHATAIEDFKKQICDLNNRLQKSLEESQIFQDQSARLDNENVSLKRQINRLSDENEQLLTHLDALEKQTEECKKLGLQQQDQLLVLEKNNQVLRESQSDSRVAELQNMLSVSLDEIKKLKAENFTITEKVEDLKTNLQEKDKNILIISQELQATKNIPEISANRVTEAIQTDGDLITFAKDSNDEIVELGKTVEKLRDRIKFYHSKIVKFAGNVKELREARKEILLLFKTYTDQVEEWKIKLGAASESLLARISGVEAENERLLDENAQLKETNVRVIEQLEAHKTDDEKSKSLDVQAANEILTAEVANLLSLQEGFKSQIEVLTTEKEEISSELMNLVEKHQEELREFDDKNRRDNVEMRNKTEENEKICIEYRKVISKLETDINLNLRELETLRQSNSVLREELKHLQSNEKEFADKSSEEILKLVQENAELAEINKKLQERRLNVKEVQSQTDDGDSASEVEEVVTTLRRENAEVLAEMNEMNQVLKERGETISKLQAHCDEIMKKLQIYETQANRNVDSITEKEERIKELQQQLDNVKRAEVGDLNSNQLEDPRDLEIGQLKLEIEGLKEKLSSHLDSSYAESETMSTSTISRADEGNRLKDLEGSWEERYGKLRNFALKLKGKIRELTAELAKEREDGGEMQQKLTTSLKTVSTIQSQCDKLEDDLESSRRETGEYSRKLDLASNEISKKQQKLLENEETITKLRKEIEDFKREKTNTETWKKQVSNKVQALRKELEANKVLKKDFESQIAKLNAELEAKEQALRAESDCLKQTRSSLEHSNNERKKNSVLSLEMQDYERSVKELSQKLDKKQELIDKLKNQVDSQKSTVNALREQNKLFEERVKEAEADVEVVRSEVVTYRKQIGEFEDVVLVKDDKIHSLTRLLETSRSENEELSTELSKVVAEHQKVNGNLRDKNEQFRSQNLGLQQSLRETQEVLKLKEDELRTVQAEYDNYKVRAQSVLRQNQSRDVGLEEKLSEEVSSLKARCEMLNCELNESKETVKVLRKNNEKLLDEKEEISDKYQSSVKETDDIRNLYDQLNSKHQQTILEHGETVRSLKVHAETLAQCYRQQLSEQEARHSREVVGLQSKIDKAPSPTEMPFPPLPSMPREEGEGSESTELTTKLNLHPVPLERLLGTDTDQEVAFVKKQLNEEESKVVHLTALLAETEQDLAKHVQMNKLLKDEIRRQQRSVEREKHAENLEYLKNVVFKFVTLHSGDERGRLVPVLNTILKLSPEETQKLSMVARGDPGIRGWANYLPMWSSPSKP